MSPTTTASAVAEPKRGDLTGAALTDEVFDSSSTLRRPARGEAGAVTGLQQYCPADLERWVESEARSAPGEGRHPSRRAERVPTTAA